MKTQKLVLTSLVLSITALMTACSSSDEDFVAMPTHLVNDTPKNEPDFTIKENALLNRAKAQTTADFGPTAVLNTYNVNINGRDYKDGNGINLKDFAGSFKLPVVETATGYAGSESRTIERSSLLYLFQQDYSLIGGIYTHGYVSKDPSGRVVETETLDETSYILKGLTTDTLPDSGIYTYHGPAMYAREDNPMNGVTGGGLSYSVNFGDKTGHGVITNLSNVSDITLVRGEITHGDKSGYVDGDVITGHGIKGLAVSDSGTGEYELGFFGENAEEIIGSVEIYNHGEGFFGGKR